MVAVKAHEADRALYAPDRATRIFLFYGPDQGLIAERAETLARSSVSDPSDPFQLVRLDGAGLASDPMRLVDEANTIGLFGGKRAIWVSSGDPKFPISAIEPLLAVPPLDAVVVLEAGDLAKSNPLRVAIERAKSAMAVPCYADEGRSLDAVIDTVLAEHRISIEREARQLLLTRIGIDRRVSRREIEKLATYSGAGGRIGIADVDAIVGDASARDIDDIVDGVFAGAIVAVDLAYRRLCSVGEDPATLLGFVSRQAQALLLTRQGVDQGRDTIQDAARTMRGYNFTRKAALEAGLRRWSTAELARLIATLHHVVLQMRRAPALAEELAARALWNLCLSGGRA